MYKNPNEKAIDKPVEEVNEYDEDDIMRDPVKRERYAPMPEDRLYPPGENPEEKK
jgi:hypothetical protein